MPGLRDAIFRALTQVRAGDVKDHDKRAMTTYIVDPSDGTLWDLKPILARANDALPRSYSTNEFEEMATREGFEIIKFRTRRARPLGMFFNRNELVNLADDDLQVIPGSEKLGKRKSLVNRFNRDPAVAAAAKRQADGKCQKCKKDAPFVMANGELYLEVHHKKPLSENGPDIIENVVALCPNCHREAHYGAKEMQFD